MSFAVRTGMKNPSPWMPEGADEATMIEVLLELLELDIRVTRREGGLRLAADRADDPHPDTDTGGPQAKLIPATA